MAHPKRQHSKQRGRKRRTHQKLTNNVGALTTAGSSMGFQHRVDPVTGMYKGRQVIDVTPKEKKNKEE
ncbi:MAG: 50S ribosomal protein L32 [Candidatus Omnitrophica bacterium]|nr:50S ribosomal protein L32 [Candidatus Omnitrophota bacterium]